MKSDKPDRFKQTTDETRRQLEDVKRLTGSTTKQPETFKASDLPPPVAVTSLELVQATRDILQALAVGLISTSDLLEARVSIVQQINVLDRMIIEAMKRDA